MARKFRLCVPNAIHHITTKLIDDRLLFYDPTDKEKFLHYLDKFLIETEFDLLGIAFYPTHYHMALRINNRPLKDLLQGFHSAYARFYNKRHGFNGYLFQGRPKSEVVQDGPAAQKLIAYLHTGPIRAHLCKSIEELDKFKDCTHSAFMGNSQFPNLKIDQIINLFSNNCIIDPKVLYRKTVELMIEKCDSYQDFLEMIKSSNEDRQDMFEPGYWVIGSQEFIQDAIKLDKQRRILMANHKAWGWDHNRLTEFVTSIFSIPAEDLRCRGRMNPLSNARKLYCYFAVRVLEMSMLSTAVRLNISRTAVGRLARQGKVIARDMKVDLPA